MPQRGFLDFVSGFPVDRAGTRAELVDSPMDAILLAVHRTTSRTEGFNA